MNDTVSKLADAKCQYLAVGAPYGPNLEGMLKWANEKVEAKEATQTIAQRTRDTIARVLDCKAETLRDEHRLREDCGMQVLPDRGYRSAFTLSSELNWGDELGGEIKGFVRTVQIEACVTVGDVVALMERKAQ